MAADNEKSIEELREEFESAAVEDDKISEASMSKEERIALENSIPILNSRDQEEADADIYRGVVLFFQNRSLEAEKIFMSKPTDPLATNCLGATLFLKAMMTFADTDIAYANTVLGRTKLLTNIYANVYKAKATPQVSQGWFSKLVSFGQQHEVSNGEMRAAVIKAECGLLSGLMNLLQESMVGYVKAGWSLRRGYKDVSWCYQQLQHSASSAAPSPITSPITSPIASPNHSPPTSPRQLVPAPKSAFDMHTLGGVQFAFGSINVVLASLPPRILKLVSFFGFSCDRDLGFDLLNKCFDGGGIRASLASLFLLSFYVHLPSFVPIMIPRYLPLAEGIIAESLIRYPGSALHLWLAGRMSRLSRALTESNNSFKKSISALESNTNDIPQLKDLCFYDLGLNHLWLLEWQEAANYFEKLAQHNYWSKAFYVFAQAICVYMKGNKEQAITLFNTIPSLIVRKYGGRTLGVEQYVLRKVKMFSNMKFELGWLPALELIYIWNGFYCMPIPLLERCLGLVNEDLQKWEKREAALAAGGSAANDDEDDEDENDDDDDEDEVDEDFPYQDDIKALLFLIKAVISQNLGESKYNDALAALDFVTKESSASEDTFIQPFAYYELGMLHFLNHKLDEAKDAFRKAREFSKYNFEYRLSFRLHLALLELSRESKTKDVEPEVEVEEDVKAKEETKKEKKKKKKEKRKNAKKNKKKNKA